MSRSQYERVSAFQEATMAEVDPPKLTPRSSYSTGFEKVTTKEPTFNYKPFALRTIPLLSLLALTLALIGLLQYAAVHLPHGALNLKRRDEHILHKPLRTNDSLRRRSGDGSMGSNFSTSTIVPLASTEDQAPSAHVQGHSTSTSSTPITGASTTAQSAYVDDTSTSVYYSMDTSAYVDDRETSSLQSVVAFAADTTAYVNEHSTSSSIPTVLQDTSQSAYVPETVTRHDLLRPTMAPSDASAPSSAYVPIHSTTKPSLESGNGYDANHSENQDNDHQDDDGDNDHGNSEIGFDSQNASLGDTRNGHRMLIAEVWDARRTFLGTYLAVCIAVIYRLFWVVLYNSFTLIEPFRQLMERQGALAEKAFFSFYQNQSNLLGPLPALMKQRWALACIGTAYLIINLLPALASESIFVSTNWECPNPNVKDTNNPCNPRMEANIAILRVLQGILAFAVAVILLTTSLLLFNKTGLPTKPNSIATVASLMRHPRLVADLREMPANVSLDHMQQLMQGKRYRMGRYTCANGLAGYGIQPYSGYDSDGCLSPSGMTRHQYTPVDGSLPLSEPGGSKLRRFQIRDFILAFFLLGAFGVVLAYYLDGSDDVFNRYFNSNTFGPRFILTLAGTVITSMWKSVEQDAIVMGPYTRLFKRPTSPGSTILLTPTSTPLSSTVRALINRYYFAASITVVTLAAEALNVVISGVPYAHGQTWTQFLVSAYMSIAILGVMIIVTTLIIISRFWQPRIPRKPTTLGAVMSYLCSSRLLDDFEGAERLDGWTRDQRLRAMHKKYEFAETVRRDGKLAWTIDEAFDQLGS